MAVSIPEASLMATSGSSRPEQYTSRGTQSTSGALPRPPACRPQVSHARVVQFAQRVEHPAAEASRRTNSPAKQHGRDHRSITGSSGSHSRREDAASLRKDGCLVEAGRG